uniref:Synaptobrevin-like protein n=1 Tax=Schistocephalus solidus TaxID=70667 RepID=A0A0X3Q9W7_SCHSO
MTRTRATAPIARVIFMFFHQYLFFNFPALASNCEAPAWRASARSSSLPRAASLSSTFSMLTRIMSTTSLTWACVCWKRLLVACEGAGLPSAGGAAAFSGWFILCTSEALLHK